MKTESFALSMQPPPFFRDHHVQDRPVLAAVEAMERLAADACGRFPEHDGRWMQGVRFDKFLFLNSKAPITAFNRVEKNDHGSIRTTLTTRFKAPGAKVTRRLEHASLIIGKGLPTVVAPPLEIAATLAGVCTVVDPARIYREMVPFGPAYRNICEPLLISADGALARVRSARPADPRSDLHLGSPYVLDAAFHAACVWCQRYCGIVVFPVSIDQRTIIRPTRLDAVYTARVVPVRTDKAPVVFDIFIYDDTGTLREAATGIHMQAVGGGRTKAPDGFYDKDISDPLVSFYSRVSGMILIERRAQTPFAVATLSEKEKARLAPMTQRRAQGYLAARLALKRLGRLLSGDGDHRHPRAIETVAEDGQSPQCSLVDGSLPFCTVSHDRRFTVAAAADRPLGVDVEPLSQKPLDAMHLYMDADEQALVDRSPLGRADGNLRIWSAKEAAAKALGIDLAESWTHLRTVAVAAPYSRLETAGGQALTAIHTTLAGHLFTLLTVDDLP